MRNEEDIRAEVVGFSYKTYVDSKGIWLVLPSLLDAGALIWTRLQILIFSSNQTTILRVLPQNGQAHRECAQRATGKLVAMVM